MAVLGERLEFKGDRIAELDLATDKSAARFVTFGLAPGEFSMLLAQFGLIVWLFAKFAPANDKSVVRFNNFDLDSAKS